ncbi:MAG: hypothetical protein JWL77_393 [Chthonomonadaceae bacterium]|nr:hypothetical protein [Chthonomonadaceae bacterium]
MLDVPGSGAKKWPRRGWLAGAILGGSCALLALAAVTGPHPSAADPSPRLRPAPAISGVPKQARRRLVGSDDAFASSVRPFLRKFCLGCHSSRVKQAGLDLERFTGPATMRQDLKPWQGVVDHLEVGDMPPQGSPQPPETEKRRIVAWVREFLRKEALATAGDPGDIPLRRLSNTEYNATIRDLTGVDLQPAREFPADGAAGEGFTNAAESLTDVSPTLLTKYLSAAHEIAEHAVLLPDGFRFAPGKTRRDWTDASTARLRAFYAAWAPADGHLDFAPYLAATVRHRADLTSGKIRIETVAAQEKLNAKYLGILWKTLTSGRPSYPLSEIQARWRSAAESDVPALIADIVVWQGALWQSVRVGSYVHPVGMGFAESVTRQLPNDPVPAVSQAVRLTIKPLPGQNDVVLRLATRDLIGANGGQVVWQNPRLVAPGKPTLSLRDYPQFGRAFEIDYSALFADSARYLDATVEAVNSPDPTGEAEKIAAKRGLDGALLNRWIDLLAVEPYAKDAVREVSGRPVPAAALELLSDPIAHDGAHPAINGWRKHGSDLPALVTNSSDRREQIPGNAAPHGVMVHPSPSEFVAVAWNSPVTGTVRVSAKIVHAHPACGNGIAWWLERRQGERASMFDEGRLELGGTASPPERTLRVRKGDTILLAIDAKDGDHSCDLTQIALKIALVGSPDQTWDLASDIADTVTTANPHPDRRGNAGVWNFVKGPTRPVNAAGSAAPTFASSSLMGRWREAAADPARRAEAFLLAAQVQRLLSGPRPSMESDPNRAVFDRLVSAVSPLLQGVDLARLPKPKPGTESLGLPISRFGGSGAGPSDLIAPANSTTEIRLPAALVAGREFVTDVRLLSPPNDHAVQVQATAEPDASQTHWDSKSPLVAAPDSPAFKQILEGCDRFRSVFPLFTCFPAVIPNDEVVSLKMFHREDEPLQRLFLDPTQTRTLDRLWHEHLFISRQPVAEQKYLPLFIGFVTQDQPKEMVAFFESIRPVFDQRAAEFQKQEAAAVPKQLEALSDFTARAYRRPLTPKEKADQSALYRSLIANSTAPDEAFRAIIARILVAPAFLFRIEQAPVGAKIGAANDWEIATRLSYFLWSSEPDAELRRAAAAGHLHTPAQLQTQARRLLQDGRMRSLAVEFGAQWLHVRAFDTLNDKNEHLFPTFDADLRGAIYEETILFFQNLFQSDRPATDLFDADYTFLNEPLAKHYGIPSVVGMQWRKVDNVRRYGRGGILGLASVQASQSGASRTSPVLRGNWVSETLLGERLPRPPANVPKLPEDESTATLSIRQEVERHTRNPACAGCHKRIDPFGFAFENYDPIGRFRDRDLGGRPIDTHATLRDGTKFEGIDGLRHYLMTTRRDQVMHLFCRRLLGYALGRAVLNSDQPLIDTMTALLNRNGGKISEAVAAIVASPQFRTTRGTDVAQTSNVRRTVVASQKRVHGAQVTLASRTQRRER